MLYVVVISYINMQTSNQNYGSHYPRSQSKKNSIDKHQSIGKTTLQFMINKDKGNYLLEQQNIAQRSRHGLFTQPMPIASGEPYEDKKPDQVPKGVSVNQRMVQKVGPQLFQKMGSTNIGDLYKDKFKETQLYVKEKQDLSIHNKALLAGGKQKLVKHSEFEHMKQFQDKQYNTRDDFGKVKTGLKNITTGNMKKGFGNTTYGHLFGAYPYQGYPHQAQLDAQSKDKLLHKAKIHKPFNGVHQPNATFTPDYVAYRNEGDVWQPRNDDTQYRSKTTQKWKYNNANKKGLYGTFTQFPAYVEEGQKKREAIKHQNVWRPNFNGTSKGQGETLARPCPAVSQMVLNSLGRDK